MCVHLCTFPSNSGAVVWHCYFLCGKVVPMHAKGWRLLCCYHSQLTRKAAPPPHFVHCSDSHSYSLEISGGRSANTDDSAAGMPDSFPGFRFEPAYWFYLLLGVTVIEFSRWRGKVLNLRTQMESRLQRERIILEFSERLFGPKTNPWIWRD